MTRLLRLLEAVLSGAFALLLLDVLWGFFSRYVMGEQSRWTEELAIYLLIWIALLGAPVAYVERAHLGVDYLVAKMDPTARWLAELVVEVVVSGFAGFALLYGGFLLVSETLQTGQLSPALGIPIGYVYLATPLSGGAFLVFSLKNLLDLLSRRSKKAHHGEV